ncbi:MAG: hypothetical protein HYZ72_19795 [Deltaproteobacteria bacterium]|nr:hypothetical protein [Deltaproteobacteria bacterium]
MPGEPEQRTQWGEVLLRVLSYLTHLLWEALCFLGRLSLDLVFAARVPLARLAQRRSPENAEVYDRQLATLRERRTARWEPWRMLPLLRRLEVGVAAVLVMGAGVVGLRSSATQTDTISMWYRGCHFIMDEYTCGVGHAVSGDSISWEKSSDPVFQVEDAEDSRQLHAVVVVHAGDRYLMWCSMGVNLDHDRLYTTLNLATSPDGLRWQDAGPVLRAVEEDTAPIEPALFYDGQTFHLWYVDIPFANGANSLMHVTSADGKQWQVVGGTPVNTLGVRPGKLWVFPDGRGGYRGLFAYPPQQQQQKGLFGLLVSTDGNTWEQRDGGANAPTAALPKDVIADTPALLSEPDGLWLWFVLRPEDGDAAIGVAYRKEGSP